MRRPLICYTILRPAGAALETLAADPRRWLPAPARPRSDQVWEVVVRADGALAPSSSAATAAVWVGEALVRPGSVLRPLSWSSAEGSVTFPSAVGELDLRRLAGGGARLLLTVAWQPGLRAPTPDGASPTDVAEAVAHAFLHDVAAQLVAPAVAVEPG